MQNNKRAAGFLAALFVQMHKTKRRHISVFLAPVMRRIGFCHVAILTLMVVVTIHVS